MNVLALEPYYAGSHQAFVDAWSLNSSHNWKLLTLPGRKWKWRMRHAAITFAEQIRKDKPQAELIFCTDMMNLTELLGLLPSEYSELPSVFYFHENQLTYPTKDFDIRDHHFAFINLISAISASEVWFNSQYHLDSYMGSMRALLKKMPDFRPSSQLDEIEKKSKVAPQGVDAMPECLGERKSGPLRIVWAARWEYDKNPEDFFQALRLCKNKGVDFRLSVLGESFKEVDPAFAWAAEEFKDQIDVWGYVESKEEYREVLAKSDLFVSTAIHEFFGISAMEAMSAGCRPLLPNRLSYPEILGGETEYLYKNQKGLVQAITVLSRQLEGGPFSLDKRKGYQSMSKRYHWNELAQNLDGMLEETLVSSKK